MDQVCGLLEGLLRHVDLLDLVHEVDLLQRLLDLLHEMDFVHEMYFLCQVDLPRPPCGPLDLVQQQRLLQIRLTLRSPRRSLTSHLQWLWGEPTSYIWEQEDDEEEPIIVEVMRIGTWTPETGLILHTPLPYLGPSAAGAST